MEPTTYRKQNGHQNSIERLSQEEKYKKDNKDKLKIKLDEQVDESYKDINMLKKFEEFKKY